MKALQTFEDWTGILVNKLQRLPCGVMLDDLDVLQEQGFDYVFQVRIGWTGLILKNWQIQLSQAFPGNNLC